MAVQPKHTPEDTRARIMDTAEALFRQLGYAKTAVADIAAELGMSPANIYRFFSSKNAIVEAICRRCLGELDENAWAVARARTPAAARLERLVLEILRYHLENFTTEKRVHDIVLVAIEDNWDAIQAHKEVIRNVIELILRDGVDAGEFTPMDAHETSKLMMRSLIAFMHPLVIAQMLKDDEDLEAAARGTIHFLVRAIAKRS
ncbi:MAG: TetR family transcriptional regulator [Xanthobacteraceae bacterium]